MIEFLRTVVVLFLGNIFPSKKNAVHLISGNTAAQAFSKDITAVYLFTHFATFLSFSAGFLPTCATLSNKYF